MFELLVREGDLRGRRVLDVGCGTGVLAAALAEREAARVWGIDAEPAMLDVARARVPAGVGLRVGSADALPFRDAWFERAVLRLVIHLVDRARALPELARVIAPGGRAAIATFDPTHFERFWLNRLFPSLEEIDRARFPEPGALTRELAAAGFTAVRVVRLSQQRELDRGTALERIRGRHISTFDLLSEEEIAAGIGRAERELPPTLDVALEWAIVVADR
ncbi:MAG TPA: methyltransferase domain-containing protein [Gaiellaceae bacterium]|nr:methyltransferase domain-containing protein [Gaiellaceae bacterium]